MVSPNHGPLTRRRLCVVIASVAASAGCTSVPLPFGLSASPTPARPRITGKLILARNGDLFLDELANLDESQIRHFDKGTFAASPAISPDRASVVYTYYVSAQNPGDLGRSYLYTIQVTGVNPTRIGTLPRVGATFEDPSWSPDGKAIYATIRSPVEENGQFRGVQTGIFRIGLDGSLPVQVVANAESSWVSPNGKDLAYLTSDAKGATVHLWVSSVAGQNAREILVNQGFSSVRAPRFSPDGRLLAFAGSGGPASAERPSGRGQSGPVATIFTSGVAEADGIPADIWVVRPDGTELRRLTHQQEHSPIPSWSPDGQWVAFLGESGLYLVDAAGKQTVRLKGVDGTSGLSWMA